MSSRCCCWCPSRAIALKGSCRRWRWPSLASFTSAGCLGISASWPTRRTPYGYLLYLIFAVELNDVAAFTCGKLFGRHKFRSEISPNKTWEGALGALAVSLTLPWLLRFSFPHFGPL